MSESAGRVVAWQYRVTLLGRQWLDCSEDQFIVATADPEFQTRALVPEQLLVDLETKVRALADELGVKLPYARNPEATYSFSNDWVNGRNSANAEAARRLRALTETNTTEAVER